VAIANCITEFSVDFAKKEVIGKRLKATER
jgi:hypothetical protein